MIQYSRALVMDREAVAYWISRFRGVRRLLWSGAVHRSCFARNESVGTVVTYQKLVPLFTPFELRFGPFEPKASRPQSNPPCMQLCICQARQFRPIGSKPRAVFPASNANQNRPSRDTPDHKSAARSSPGGAQLRSVDPG